MFVCLTFFALDTTTHQLVSILDLALKFNCLPLLVLEAKRKLFGGNVFGLFVFLEVCVWGACCWACVSRKAESGFASMASQVSMNTKDWKKLYTFGFWNTFLCPSPSFLRKITSIFDHEAQLCEPDVFSWIGMPLLKMLPSALSNEQVTLKVAKALSRWWQEVQRTLSTRLFPLSSSLFPPLECLISLPPLPPPPRPQYWIWLTVWEFPRHSTNTFWKIPSICNKYTQNRKKRKTLWGTNGTHAFLESQLFITN